MGFPSKESRGTVILGKCRRRRLSIFCRAGTALHREEGPEPVLSGEEGKRYTQGPGLAVGQRLGLAKLLDREGVVWVC